MFTLLSELSLTSTSALVIQPCSRPQPDLLEQTDQFRSFVGFEHGHCFLHVVRVLLKGTLNQASARLRELDDPAAPIFRSGNPPKQFPRFQTIDGGGYRTACQQNLLAYDIYRQRSLVEEHFQYGEIRKAQAERGYTLHRVLFDRVGCFPQDEPDSYRGFAAPLGSGHFKISHCSVA